MSETPVLERITSSLEDGVFTVTFNRPEKKNAFTVAMYDGLTEALARAQTDDEVRVVVFTGVGDVFTSGNDLLDFMNAPPAGEDSAVFRFLVALSSAEKPIIAAVDGPAIGIGVTMLLHVDLVYAAAGSRFQLPFVSLGLVPEGASTLLLPRLAGYAKTAELIYFGEMFDANTALEIGLVNEVVPPGGLKERVRERAKALADRPIGALKDTKRLLRGPLRAEVQAALQREGEKFIERLASPEAMEAFGAFFEKRKPDFRKLGQ